MNLLAQTDLNAVRITVESRDQYNDYSVVYDYYVTVNDPNTGYFRQWHCGTKRERALDAYRAAVAFVGKAAR
jgi:hypothetical protein